MSDSFRLPDRTGDRLRWLLAPAAVFVIALVAFGALFHSFPVLYDTDSYYHLAIARTYARHGVVDVLPWARLSLLREFADKEFLFHLLLLPFAGEEGSTSGGRWGLAALNALIAATLAALGRAAVGRWGLLAPLLVYGGSIDFLGRAIRLRPELLSLVLLLAAVACAGQRRYRTLGLVAALYAVSYTAFHALLGLVVAWFCQQLWAHRRPEWRLLLYPILGVSLGLLVHPHFPRNLVVWKVQSIDYFQHKGALNVGAEIGSHLAPEFLWLNLAWWLAIAAVWRSAEKRGVRRDDPTADFLWIATLAFGILYVLMLRFSIYFIPFATLAVLYEIRRRGQAPGPWVRLPWRGRLPSVAVLAVVLLVALPRAGGLLRGLAGAGGEDGKSSVPREVEWQAFARQLPKGARVAAEWGATHIYMFWAPQALYLNVLDPVFMHLPYPDAYRALRAVMEAREPDVALTLRRDLLSDYLALSRFHPHQKLLQRLAGDPRIEPRYQGYTLLYEVVPDKNRDFVLDWRVIPAGSRVPPPEAEAIAGFAPYPLARDPELRAVEAFVDTTRVNPGECLALVHREEVENAEARLYELAPYGPTQLWVDDRLVLATSDTFEATLGRDLTFPVRFEPGSHRISVLTCPGRDGSGRSGFYLLRRDPGTPALDPPAADDPPA